MRQKKVHKKTKKAVISKLEKKSNYIILVVLALSLVLFAVTQSLSGKTQENLKDTSSEASEESELNQENELEDTSQQEEEQRKETISESNLALPANFPQDFPRYPGAEIASTSSDGKTTVVELKTPDSLETVTDYYKTKLKQESWEITSSTEISNAAVFEFSKKNLYGALIISDIEGKTKILIDVGPFPEGGL